MRTILTAIGTILFAFFVGLGLLYLFLWPVTVFPAEICLSEQDAGRLILSYEQGEICKAEVSEWAQYSTHKEAEITAKDSIISAYKEQVAKDEQTIHSLRDIALKPTPKFKVLLSPALYIEGRALGSVSSDLLRGGVKLDILKAWGVTFYGKVEGALRDETFSNIFNSQARTMPYGVYVGAEWRPW